MIKKMSSLGVLLISIFFSIMVIAQDGAATSTGEPLVESEQMAPADTMEADPMGKKTAPGNTMDAPPKPAVPGSVARSAFSTGIADREPADNISTANTNTDTVFFFTELVDFQGQTVTHRWEYNGENMAEVKFNVGGPRWRVHSSKKLLPEWLGTWKVLVVDANGQTVTSETLEYTAAAPASSPETVPEPMGDAIIE